VPGRLLKRRNQNITYQAPATPSKDVRRFRRWRSGKLDLLLSFSLFSRDLLLLPLLLTRGPLQDGVRRACRTYYDKRNVVVPAAWLLAQLGSGGNVATRMRRAVRKQHMLLLL
jgi:hypothetical protein